MPEGRGIFPNLTVSENLALTARRRRRPPRLDTSSACLRLFPRLTERRAKCGQQLSGGEQKMLAIGRALMTNPGC